MKQIAILFSFLLFPCLSIMGQQTSKERPSWTDGFREEYQNSYLKSFSSVGSTMEDARRKALQEVADERSRATGRRYSIQESNGVVTMSSSDELTVAAPRQRAQITFPVQLHACVDPLCAAGLDKFEFFVIRLCCVSGRKEDTSQRHEGNTAENSPFPYCKTVFYLFHGRMISNHLAEVKGTGYWSFTIFHLPSRLSKRTRAFSPPRARFLRPPIARRSSLLPIASWQVRLLAQARPAEHVDSGAGPCGRLRRRFATCPTKQSFFGAFAASRRSGCSPLTETRRWPRRA